MSYTLITGLFSGMNTATDMWSGAIDVVVVEQPDGTLKCTPFHVRFGRLKVLRSKEKVIRIMINGKLTELCMKIGEAGEAYFVHEANGPVDRDLVCSPIDLGVGSSIFNTSSSLDPTKSTITADTINENNNFSSTTTVDSLDSLTTSSSTTPSLLTLSLQSNQQQPIPPMATSTTTMDQAYFKPIRQTSPVGSPNLAVSPIMNSPYLTPRVNTFDIDEEIIHEKFIPIDDEDGDITTNSINNSLIQEMSELDLEREKKRLDGITTTGMLNDTPIPSSLIGSNNTDAVNTTASISSPTVTSTSENATATTQQKKSGWGWASGISSWFGFKNENDEFQGIKTKGNNAFVEQQFLEVMAKHYNYDAVSGRYINSPLNSPVKQPTTSTSSNVFNNLTDANNMAQTTTNIPRNDSCKNLISDTTTSDDEISYDPFTGSEHLENVNSNENVKLNDDTTDEEEEEDEEEAVKNYHSDNENNSTLSSLKPSLPPHMIQRSIPRKHFELSVSTTNCSKSAPGSSNFDELFQEHQLTKMKRLISPPSKLSTPTENNFAVPLTDTTITETPTTPTLITITPNTQMTSNLSDPSLQKKNEKTYWRWFWSRPGSGATHSVSDVNPSNTHINEEVDRVVNQPQVFDPTGEFKVLKKSLRPNSDELKTLGLQYGKNEIKFLVTSRILGTQEINAYIYLWKHSDKIVISDVDGTITKSDALGHILPMLGQDWSHSGISKLYTKIAENGYRILYLTSRSIIQSGSTKRYIFSLQQEDAMLPEGPVVMSPDRLFAALHREVILKKPEEFKKAALSDVLDLFPQESKPFFAGFGNRVNDQISYSFVGVPDHKIFTINPTGLIQVYGIKHESYWNIYKLVDEMFPDMNQKVDEPSTSEFNSFAYWRMPIQSSKDFK